MWTITAWVLEKCAQDYFVDVTRVFGGAGQYAEETQE
jgi:hypothetical protein